jgi:hypothetical protein
MRENGRAVVGGEIDPSSEPLRIKERFLRSASQPFAPFEAQGKESEWEEKVGSLRSK